jgi:hypothetical protein
VTDQASGSHKITGKITVLYTFLSSWSCIPPKTWTQRPASFRLCSTETNLFAKY